MSHQLLCFFSRSQIKVKNNVKSLNQSGVSLVELLVVVGIMAVIGAGLAIMMMNANKEARSVNAKTDFSTLVSDLQAVFNNSGNCLAAFGGSGATTLGPAFPQPVTLPIGGNPITVGNYGTTLKITKFEFISQTATGAVRQFVAPIYLEADRSIGTQTAVGGNILTHTFNVIVTLDAANKIIGCSGQYDNFWVPAFASPNDIVFSGGKVGIGTITPSTTLEVNGTTLAKAYMYKSDRRLKENIREIPSSLERTLKLHGVMFDWKNKENIDKSTNQLGFIAQEVEEIFPELVMTSSVNGLKAVSYGNLVAPLIEAFKEQQEIILKQQKEIAEIKKQLSSHHQSQEVR